MKPVSFFVWWLLAAAYVVLVLVVLKFFPSMDPVPGSLGHVAFLLMLITLMAIVLRWKVRTFPWQDDG